MEGCPSHTWPTHAGTAWAKNPLQGKVPHVRKPYCIALILSLFTLALSAAAETSAAPLKRLQISDNGRCIVRDDGTGFFPIADTVWAMAWRMTRDQVDAYLQHRKAQHFNTIALVAFPSYDGKEVCPNAYGDSPFALAGGRFDPLKPLTTPGHSPEDPAQYDYWDHLDYIIASAGAHGMYVVLLPAWGGAVAGNYGNGKPTEEIIFGANKAYTYGCWIGQRYRASENVIWMMGGDRSAVYGERDYRPVFHAMAEGVADGVNGVHQFDGKADYGTTLMSYHPRKWNPNSSEWFHTAAWLDFNSIQDQPKDQVAATERDYGLSPAKPTWLFEGGYEYRTRGDSQYRDWQIRFQSYQTVFAGGFGVTYGSMNVYHCASAGDPGKWAAALDEAGSLDMQHLYALMTSVDNSQFLQRIPDQSLIDGGAGRMDAGEGVRSSRLQATRGAAGDYAMVYSANGRNIRMKMDRLAPPRMDAFWFNPRNGTWHTEDGEHTEQTAFERNLPSGSSAPIREFAPPGGMGDGNDWVLVLRTAP